MAKRRPATAPKPRPTSQPLPPAGDVAPAVEVAPQGIGALADALAEASIVVAVATVPLYFSVITTTGYEADKAALLRVIAALAGAGWVLGALFGRPIDGRVRRDPLLWLAVAFFGTYCLATLLSIDPRLSFFGSTRQEGLVTHAAYLTIFLCVATRLRRRAQIERILTAIIFASLAAVAYGVVEQLGLDPIPFKGGDPSILQWPVRSTMGQHVFFGSYLVLVIPLTAARWMQVWRTPGEERRTSGDEPLITLFAALFVAISFVIYVAIAFHNPVSSMVFPAVCAVYALLGLFVESLPNTAALRQARLWLYGVIFLGQVLTLAFTGARGPWLGCFISLPVFALLAGWRLREPRIYWSVLGLAGAFALFVLVLNIPNGPLQPLRTTHSLARLANLREQGGTIGSEKGRLQIWKGVGTLFTQTPSVGGQWGGPLRDVVGYGPETMHLAFGVVFPLELRRLTSEVWSWDRAHDIYLDTMIDAGILGLLALLGLIVFFFRRMYALIRSDDATTWLVIGLTSAMVGHLVEGAFGLETPATFLLFFVLLGIAVCLPRLEREETVPERPSLTLPPVLMYGGAVVLAVALLAPASSLVTYPAILAALWLAATLSGVAMMTVLLLPRLAARPARRAVRGQPRSLPQRLSGRTRLAIGSVMLAAMLVVASQFQFEVAAFAELLSYQNFITGNQADGLSFMQQTVRSAGYEPAYWEELGSDYLNLATTHGSASGDPSYHPSSSDPNSLDPNKAIILGRDQLFALSVAALHSARGLAPVDPTVYDDLGTAYLNWNRPTQAKAEYLHAERLSHDDPKFLAKAALADMNAHNYAAADAELKQAITWDKTYWYTYFVQAQVYHAAHYTAGAKYAATLALYWEPLTWPAAPQVQINQLTKLARTG